MNAKKSKEKKDLKYLFCKSGFRLLCKDFHIIENIFVSSFF